MGSIVGSAKPKAVPQPVTRSIPGPGDPGFNVDAARAAGTTNVPGINTSAAGTTNVPGINTSAAGSDNETVGAPARKVRRTGMLGGGRARLGGKDGSLLLSSDNLKRKTLLGQ